jgi:NAD(P)-dependent dehydrogenase (short-subunit alcohol dehydrogenase family)
MRLENTVAVVTGAARGIGAACARRLAEEGADVVLVDVLDGVRGTAEGIDAETPGSGAAVMADVSEEADVEALADRVADGYGGVDVLVNNAGIRRYGPVTEVTAESWDEIIDVNLKGYAFCAKHLIPAMAENDGGSIVNVSSIHAEVGRPGMAQYDATKGGVLSLTRSLAADHGDQGIRANAVLPGPVLTEFHVEERGMDPSLTEPHEDGPGIMNRWAEPREVADGVLFLASEASSFMTGRKLLIDGGTGFEMDPV